MENSQNNEDNPFIIKKKPDAASSQPKRVFTANDFDEVTEVKKKSPVVSPTASPNGSQTSGTPLSTSQVQTNPSLVNPLAGGYALNDVVPSDIKEGVIDREKNPFKVTIGKPLTENTLNAGMPQSSNLADQATLLMNNERISPAIKTQSEKLKQIQAAYQGDRQELNKGISAPSSASGSITTAINDKDRDGNRATYVYNKLLNGIGGLANFVGDVGATIMAYSPDQGYSYDPNNQPKKRTAEDIASQRQILTDYRKQVSPVVRDYLTDKFGADVDDGLTAKYDNEFITSAVGGVAQSIPAMLAPAPIRMAAMIGQGYDAALQSVEASDTNGDIDDLTKSIYALGVGSVNGMLEKVGFDRIFGAQTTQISKAITNKAIKEAAESGGGKVTADALSKFINSNLVELTGKFGKVGTKAVEGFLTEFATGSSQEITTIGSELLLNKVTGKPIFDTSDVTSWDGIIDNLKRVAYAGAQEGVGGGIMGIGASIINGVAGRKTKLNIESYERINQELEDPGLSGKAREFLVQQKIKIREMLAANSQAESPDAESKAELNSNIESSANDMEVLADELAEAITPGEVAEIKAKAEALSKTGIESTQELSEITKKELVDDAISESKSIISTIPDGQSFQEGSTIEYIDADGKQRTGFFKEQLADGQAVVATVEDGIYNEQIVPLPQQPVEPNLPLIESEIEQQINAENKDSLEPIANTNVEPGEFTGKTPDELALMYNEEVNTPSLTNIESAIADMPFSINRESYGDVGDSNNITASKARSYFKKDALSADQIAQDINDTKFDGNEVVTPQDIIDFIDKFPNGPQTVRQQSGNPRLRQINDAYFDQTGKKLNQRSAQEIVDASIEIIDKTPDERIDEIETELTRVIDSEGITLDNIDSLQEQMEFLYGEEAFNDIKAQLIFENNETGTRNDNPGETQLDQGIVEPESSGNPTEVGSAESGGTAVESKAGNTAGTERIASAERSVDDATSRVVELQREANKLQESLNKNLKENQSNLFGDNKTQSLFDDKADQQKIVTDKVNELHEAQKELAKVREELAAAQEAEGQVSLELPESKVEIDGSEVDLANTNEDDDAKIIEQSVINPFKIISAIQKGVNKFETAVFEKLTSRITNSVADNLKAWRTSKSTAKQWASSLSSSVLGGIARNATDINMKLGLIGGKNMAVHNMGKIMKSLYAMVDGNTESLERVHVVLDPDFYQQGLGGQADMNKPNVPSNLTYNDLTAEEKQLFDEVRKNLDDVHFKNFALGFITQDVFDKYKGTYVPRMYETFELPSEVQEALDSYQEQVGDKLNLNPFKRRKGLDALSDESKNAVLKDPVYLAAKRMMELDTNSAIMTYINHINRNSKDLVHTGTGNIPANFVKMEGKAYGALDGKYVASFVSEDLKGYMFVNKNLNLLYDGLKMYDRTWARKGIKKGLTVLNPFVQLGNFTSNVVFAQMAGVDFVRWFAGAKAAYDSLKSKDTDYEELLAAGLIGTDILRSDLMPNTENANSLLQQAKAEEENSIGNKNWNPYKWWKKLDKGAMDLYGGSDDWAKINAYKIFKGEGLTNEQAQKKVYEGFQNYATVGKAWDVASKTPVFGNPFVKFPADLMRITGNAVSKKPLSTALYLAGLYMLPQLLKQIGASEAEDEDKKELRESRPFIPKMDLGFVNIPLVYKTKIGEVNLARYITPYFYFDNAEDGALSSMASKFAPFKTVTMQGYGKGNEITVPFGQDPILGTLYNIMIDTDFRGKSIQDPDATRYRASGVTEQKQWENKASNALRTWIPNGGLIQDTYLNAKYGEDFYGRTRTMAQSLINFAVKIQDFKDADYKKTAEKQLFSITNDLRSQAETIKNTAATNARKMQRLQENFNEGKYTPSEYQNSLDRLQSEYQKSIEGGYKNLEELKKKQNDFQKKWAKFLD